MLGALKKDQRVEYLSRSLVDAVRSELAHICQAGSVNVPLFMRKLRCETSNY